jgi:putative DNA primase/helicase
MSLHELLSRLKRVRRQGNSYMAICPSHDDRNPSLSIKEKDGRILLHCFAGCSYEQVRAALGIDSSELNAGETNMDRGTYEAKRIVATYDYRDESETLLFQSVRYEPKAFAQRRPDGKGWQWNLDGVRRVLYRLPELLASDLESMVFIVEGEKDVEQLFLLGIVATTNACGAGKWREEYNEFLRGRMVCILPDNDSPGRKHTSKVSSSLQGVAASIRILELPNLPPGGDFSDWLESGGTREQLEELAQSAPEVSPQTEVDERKARVNFSAPQLIRMSDVETEEVTWLWYPYIPCGKLTIIEGDPGLGKSWLLCAFSAAITAGTSLPTDCLNVAKNVLMLSAEDGIADTLKPRLEKLGADSTRLFTLIEPLTLDETGLHRLEELIIKSKAALVTIDPLFGFTGRNVDIHRANECRSITARLAVIAERYKCAIIAVRHLAKARGNGHALNAGIGSIDITAAVRSVLLVGKDPNDDANRAIVQIKNNLAPIGPAIGFTLRGGEFLWTGESNITAQSILMDLPDLTQRSALSEAIDFFHEALADGPREVTDLKDEARQAGISEQTLRRAREHLGIKAKREGQPGSRQRFFWSLSVQHHLDNGQNEQHEHHPVNNKPKGSRDDVYVDDVHMMQLDQNSVSNHLDDVHVIKLEQNPVSKRTNGVYS